MAKKLISIISVFFLSFHTLSEVKELTILHTNDLHAHLFPRIAPWINESRKIGGFANLATLVKQEKQLNPNNILIDAGISFEVIPPRYRSTYFSHIIGGYSAGYYSYIWSEVLDADTVEWFKLNGGLITFKAFIIFLEPYPHPTLKEANPNILENVLNTKTLSLFLNKSNPDL